jgi:hypothetical protein
MKIVLMAQAKIMVTDIAPPHHRCVPVQLMASQDDKISGFANGVNDERT